MTAQVVRLFRDLARMREQMAELQKRAEEARGREDFEVIRLGLIAETQAIAQRFDAYMASPLGRALARHPALKVHVMKLRANLGCFETSKQGEA